MIPANYLLFYLPSPAWKSFDQFHLKHSPGGNAVSKCCTCDFHRASPWPGLLCVPALSSPQDLRPKVGENPSLLKNLHFLDGSVSLDVFNFKPGPGRGTAEPAGTSSYSGIIHFLPYLLIIFPVFREYKLSPHAIGSIRLVGTTDATFLFRSPKFNLGLGGSFSSHLCGDTRRSFYCGAEGNASRAAGLCVSPSRSIINDAPATELIKTDFPQLSLARSCLF